MLIFDVLEYCNNLTFGHVLECSREWAPSSMTVDELETTDVDGEIVGRPFGSGRNSIDSAANRGLSSPIVLRGGDFDIVLSSVLLLLTSDRLEGPA